MPGRFMNDRKKSSMQRRTQQRRIAVSTLTHWVIGLLIVAIILLNLFTHVVQIVRYNGNAMQPELRSGQTLILRRTQMVAPGDIIAFYYNNQVLVRRVIATEGQQVRIDQNGTVQVDTQQLAEEYLQSTSLGQCNIEFPYLVPPESYFVMGDNRATSMDSRLEQIGPVPKDRIIGRVIFVI